MGIQERREIEKVKMKQMIRDAAIEIMELEGYEKLSIRKIAAKIEYSPTTIYLYYKDKAEIISDMSDELYGKVMRDIAAVLNENPALPVEEQAYAVLSAFIRGLCSEPEMVKAIMNSGRNVIFANDCEGGTPSNAGLEMFDHFISEGIAGKVFRENLEHASWMIVSALLGFVMSSVANGLHQKENFTLLTDEFIKILMDGMKR